MATVIEEFVAKLGWQVDKKGLSTFTKQVSDLKSFAATGARYARNFAIGFSAFFNVTALAHARLFKLGAATSFQAETLEALDNSLSGTGLSFDTLVKASARFQAQMGDLKLGTASKEVTDALGALNISASELTKLSPEESFVRVTDAIIEMDDAQIAMSASTALLGQRAAQVVGHYRSIGQTVSQQIELYRKISLVNDESRKGTERYAAAVLDLKDIMTGISRYLAGITGAVFGPYVEQLKEWLIVNKELVRSRLKEFVQGIASAMKSLISLGSFITGIVEKLGGLGNTFKLIGIAVAAIKLAPLVMSLGTLIAMAPNLGAAFAAAGAAASASWLPVAALLAGILLIADDIWASLEGRDSLGGAIEEKLGISKTMDAITGFIASLVGLEKDEFYQTIFDAFDSISESIIKADAAVTDFMNNALWFAARILDAFGQWGDAIWMSLKSVEDKVKATIKNMLGETGVKVINSIAGFLGDRPSAVPLVGGLASRTANVTASTPTIGGAVTIYQTTNVETNASAERIAYANKLALARSLDRMRSKGVR